MFGKVLKQKTKRKNNRKMERKRSKEDALPIALYKIYGERRKI